MKTDECDIVDDPYGLDDSDMENTHLCLTHGYYEGPGDMPCPGRAVPRRSPPSAMVDASNGETLD